MSQDRITAQPFISGRACASMRSRNGPAPIIPEDTKKLKVLVQILTFWHMLQFCNHVLLCRSNLPAQLPAQSVRNRWSKRAKRTMRS